MNNLQKWIQQESKKSSDAYIFLPNREYSSFLNTFFEVKDKIPVAITNFGGIIYAEEDKEDYLFSIFHSDEWFEFHLANSMQEMSKFLATKDSRAYRTHIELCPISPYDTNYSYQKSAREICKAQLGTLKEGEIYGWKNLGTDNKLVAFSVSHWLGTKNQQNAAIVKIESYFSQIKELFSARLVRYFPNHSGEYTRAFYTFYKDSDYIDAPEYSVKKIVYHSYRIREYLPKFENIRVLNCSADDFGGDFSLISEKLTKIYYLHLSRFSSNISSLVQHLSASNLINLSLHNHEIIPDLASTKDWENLKKLEQLKRLYLSGISIPEDLIFPTRLEILSLSNNLMQSLPADVENCKELKVLEIFDNKIFNLEIKTSKLNNLKILKLENTSVSTLPLDLFSLENLEILDLNGSPIQSLPREISQLKKLKSLNINNCALTSLPEELTLLPCIEVIEAKGNPIQQLPPQLKSLKHKLKIEPKFKALYDEKIKLKLEKEGQKPAIFQDFNIKLMVIQELMYRQKLLQPMFDVEEFAETYTEREIDIEKEGFNIIPEVREYFEKLEVPKIFLEEIEEMYADGGDDIYLQLCPLWDGEDNRFSVRSIKDIKNMPNLKRIRLLPTKGNNLLLQLERMGITIS